MCIAVKLMVENDEAIRCYKCEKLVKGCFVYLSEYDVMEDATLAPTVMTCEACQEVIT